jgi:hypothetical protein
MDLFLARPHIHTGDGGYVGLWVVLAGFGLAFLALIVAVVIRLRKQRRR